MKQDKINKKENKEKKRIIKKDKKEKQVKEEKEYIIQDTEKTVNLKFSILAIVIIIIFCAMLTPITLQNDTYYTIKIGEHIIQNRGIDMQDPFSWHDGLPYFYPHWLYDVITYLVYNAFGMQGIFFATLLLSALMGVVMYLTSVEISKNRLISFIITLSAMYLLKDYIAARAQLVTFILFEFEILFIERFLKSKKIKYGFGLFFIALIIANVHSAVWPFFYILFLPYLAEFILNLDFISFYYADQKITYGRKLKKYELKLKKLDSSKTELKEKYKNKIKILKDIISKIPEKELRAKERNEKRREKPYKIRMIKEDAFKWLVLIMVICILTGFLTPIKDMPFTYLLRTMQGNTTQNISEHLPLTLINHKALMVGLAAILAVLILTDTKIRLKDLFMFLGLTVLMLMTRRQESMFLIFCGFVLAKLLSDLFAKYDKNGAVEFQRIMTKPVGIVALMFLLTLFVIMRGETIKGDKFVNESNYPVHAAEYIKNNLDLDNIRLFNEYNYGSYLLFKDIPVFIDSRCDLYTPEFNKTDDYPNGRDIFTDYIKTSNIQKYYGETFEKYDITHIILYKRSKLNMLISKETDKYRSIYEDGYFKIYEIVN